MADAGGDEVGGMVLVAWDAFLEQAATVDLERFFFFQAEDGIRDIGVTGVQTCALPISGVDIDGVRDPKTGIIDPTALEILRRLDSYGEISPSLLGAKVWVRAELPGGRARDRKSVV